MGFFAVLTAKGVQYLKIVSFTTAPALGITMDKVFLAVPVAGALVVLALSFLIVSDIRQLATSAKGGVGDVD